MKTILPVKGFLLLSLLRAAHQPEEFGEIRISNSEEYTDGFTPSTATSTEPQTLGITHFICGSDLLNGYFLVTGSKADGSESY